MTRWAIPTSTRSSRTRRATRRSAAAPTTGAAARTRTRAARIRAGMRAANGMNARTRPADTAIRVSRRSSRLRRKQKGATAERTRCGKKLPPRQSRGGTLPSPKETSTWPTWPHRSTRTGSAATTAMTTATTSSSQSRTATTSHLPGSGSPPLCVASAARKVTRASARCAGLSPAPAVSSGTRGVGRGLRKHLRLAGRHKSPSPPSHRGCLWSNGCPLC
mmetsp:Transcript_24983/g.59463  ORF Transcript_24983/g.59463 Transcript_24983/m.59463 type:complete len:219 (-) Transcript_24983:1229-1885(-)